jgi:hypothetical protein
VSAPRSSRRPGLAALHRALLERGGELAAHVPDRLPPAAGREPPGGPQSAATGPRTAGREDEYELALELIAEGHALHYHGGRLVRPSDPDLALLLGDRLYADGLAELVRLGDVEAVGELADVIALCAAAHVRDDPELARAAWLAGGAAVGYGSSPAHAAAKRRARAGHSGAADVLTAVARQLAEGVRDGAGREIPKPGTG